MCPSCSAHRDTGSLAVLSKDRSMKEWRGKPVRQLTLGSVTLTEKMDRQVNTLHNGQVLKRCSRMGAEERAGTQGLEICAAKWWNCIRKMKHRHSKLLLICAEVSSHRLIHVSSCTTCRREEYYHVNNKQISSHSMCVCGPRSSVLDSTSTLKFIKRKRILKKRT